MPDQGSPDQVPEVSLVAHGIDIPGIIDRVSKAEAGAIDVFIGTTRNNNNGRAVTALEYSAFEEMALEQMSLICGEVKNRWNVTAIVIVHRLGRVRVGEASVVIAVSSPHRKEAFESCRYAIDTLKRGVPIWKKEFYEEGESWVDGNTPDA